MAATKSTDVFAFERHGDVTVIVASPALEKLDHGLAEQAAEIVLSPFRGQEAPMVVIDLSQVDYFGSIFLALLIRCWKMSKSTGGQMALAGLTPRTRELLRITSLDMIWPIYSTQREAIDALLID